jgi:uncharacterized membrane protein
VLWANVVIVAILAIWAGSMWVAPYTVEEGSLDLYDEGRVGRIDNANVTEDLNGFASWIYNVGDKQCHQIPSRTLYLNGNPMPFCARDVAIYTFLAIGMAITAFPMLPWYDRITDIKALYIVVALVPIGIDGVGQLLGYWESTNPTRLITGGLAGGISGLAMGFMVREVSPIFKEAPAEFRAWREDRRLRKTLSEMAPPPSVASLDEPAVPPPEGPEGGAEEVGEDHHG